MGDIGKLTTIVALLLVFGPAGCSTTESADKSESGSASAETRPENASAEGEAGGSSAEQTESSGETTASTSEGEAADLPSKLPNGAEPFDGIVTAGQPTKAQFETLDEAGIETVVNFRTPEEGSWDEEKKAKEMGLTYVNIPIGGADDLNRKNVETFSDVLRKEEGPILVHCSSSNRVGAMFALRAFWVQGKSAEEAMAIGKKAGLDSLEDAVRAKLEQGRE